MVGIDPMPREHDPKPIGNSSRYKKKGKGNK